MDLAQRGAIALNHQVESLRREFDDWRARAVAGQPLQKHNSQINKITGGLENLLGNIGAPAAGTADFAANARARSFVRGAHIIWDYFRSKLALRDVDWYRDELMCVDEFAWACYEPALKLAGAAGRIDATRLKEPPLVFFSGDDSPFIRTRGRTITAQGISDREAEIFGAAILSMPIPVVGVPWFQLNHLPAAVVIAHEVGHAIGNDFRLDSDNTGTPALGAPPEIKAAIDLLNLGDRKNAWLAWSSELFADAYGVLCCGRAALIGLIDYLAGERPLIEREQLPDASQAGQPDQGWGSYPTRYLRMRFNFELLTQLALNDGGLKDEWQTTYGPSHRMFRFDVDVVSVVTALLTTPLAVFGDRPLRDVISFSQADQERAVTLSGQLTAGIPPAQGTPFRITFAALALAYRKNPDGFTNTYAHATPTLAAQIVRSVPPGIRSAEKSLPASVTDAQSTTADRVGGDLLRILSTL